MNRNNQNIGQPTNTHLACAEVMVETGRTTDYQNCDQVEASCITDLAAFYRLTHLKVRAYPHISPLQRLT